MAFVLPAQEEDECCFTFISDRDCVLVLSSFLAPFPTSVCSFLAAFAATGLDTREILLLVIGVNWIEPVEVVHIGCLVGLTSGTGGFVAVGTFWFNFMVDVEVCLLLLFAKPALFGRVVLLLSVSIIVLSGCPQDF